MDEYRFGRASVVGGEVGVWADADAIPGSATPPNGALGLSFPLGGGGALPFGPS